MYFVVLISEQCKRDKKGVGFFLWGQQLHVRWEDVCKEEAFSGIPMNITETHARDDWTQLWIIDTNN